MLESIEYSKNIQQRIFPTIDEVQNLLPNSFLYFRPKDVVSGDFYWVHRKGNKTYFSVADCTGHGVPGAFMTLISLNLINAIILEDNVNSTAVILERLHVKLKERLTSSEEEQMKHGLDIAMCSYNHDTNELEYSGLHNPMYIINSDNEIRVIKGDNLFLGISSNFNVTNHVIEVQSGDSVYLSTDGFPDQKGGERGKKFYYSRLRNILRVVNSKPLKEREDILEQKFKDWKGELEQIDDVCIMGVTF
jgi:serine phosphatase RsbU (regulator of sigma subunit)